MDTPLLQETVFQSGMLIMSANVTVVDAVVFEENYSFFLSVLITIPPTPEAAN